MKQKLVKREDKLTRMSAGSRAMADEAESFKRNAEEVS